MRKKMTRKRKTRHPERDQIVQAVRSGVVPFRDHLEECESCRSVYEFLLLCHRVECTDFEEAHPAAVNRHAALPLVIGDWTPRNSQIGRTVRDSWINLPATVTRDAAMGLERSLRLSAGPIALELVGDRSPEGWRFVARCYRRGAATGEFVLKVGRERLQPGLHECYSWTSRKPPRRIQLLSPALLLTFDTGKW